MLRFLGGLLVAAGFFLGIPVMARADGGTSALPPLPRPSDETPPPAPPPPPAPLPPPTAARLPDAPPPYAPPPPVAAGTAPDTETTAEPETADLAGGFARIPKLLVLSVGPVFAFPEDTNQNDGQGLGIYAGFEFALLPSRWFSPRAYAGLLVASADENSCNGAAVPCHVSAQIGVLGIKGRLTIPIPYVAPFIETGVGMSVGAMSTHTVDIDKRLSGVAYNIPFSLGLSFGIGQRRFMELAFAFLYHPDLSQIDGAFTLSLFLMAW